MPRPNRRGTRRRGGRGSSSRSAAGQRRGSGYGSRSASANSAPMYAVLGGAGALLVIVLIFLIAGGSGDDTPADNPTDVVEQNPEPVKVGGPGPVVLQPFPEGQKKQIEELIERLDENYDHAKELKDEGFRAQDRQDYEAAQKAWREAYDMLFDMNGQVELLLDPMGDDVWDRLERFLPRCSRAIGRWSKLQSDMQKSLK